MKIANPKNPVTIVPGSDLIRPPKLPALVKAGWTQLWAAGVVRSDEKNPVTIVPGSDLIRPPRRPAFTHPYLWR